MGDQIVDQGQCREDVSPIQFRPWPCGGLVAGQQIGVSTVETENLDDLHNRDRNRGGHEQRRKDPEEPGDHEAAEMEAAAITPALDAESDQDSTQQKEGGNRPHRHPAEEPESHSILVERI